MQQIRAAQHHAYSSGDSELKNPSAGCSEPIGDTMPQGLSAARVCQLPLPTEGQGVGLIWFWSRELGWSAAGSLQKPLPQLRAVTAGGLRWRNP